MVIDIPTLCSCLKKIKTTEEKRIALEVEALAHDYTTGLVVEALVEALADRLDPETASNEYIIVGGTPFYNRINKISGDISRCKTYQRALEGKN